MILPGTKKTSMKNPVDYLKPAQIAAESALVKMGFYVVRVAFDWEDNPAAGATIYMSRRKKGRMLLGQIEPDGLINGESVADFRAFVKANS